ncbi:MAG: cyclic nucleotide-binding domain-containing protein [Anaerolineae bacterium]
MSVTKLLKQVQLFASLNSAELAELANISQKVTANPGDVIIKQNTTGKELYLVAEGSVEVFIEGLESARSLVILGEGQVIGEMALIDQGYRSASVKVNKKGATLYRIDSDDFYRLCNKNTRIGYVVMRNLAIDIAFKLRHRNLAEL